MNKKNIAVSISILAALFIGLGAGYYYVGSKMQHEVPATQEEGGKALFYRNPMNPAITSPTPAKDEMGMDYIPVYAEDDKGSDDPTGTVRIDPVMAQNIGVRTKIAKKQILNRTIRAVGRVAYNEERMTSIHLKTEGWIEELYINKTGERVEYDTILLSIYSPQLVATQQEYLIALKNLEILKDSPFPDIRQGAIDLVASSKKRLELFDVSDHQLKELTASKNVKKSLHIHSRFSGIVLKLGAKEGQFVTPQNELYMLADLSSVWVYVDVYENELPWVKLGDVGEMTVAAVPGKVFSGKVSFIYPYMEQKTRTARMRLEFDNEDGQLKPDMFANVTLQTGRKVEAVVIPSEALVRSGTRVQVFIRRDEGKFEPREVKVGISAAGLTQILSGVEVGEEVVTSSQFLIDSESKLREATAKMLEIMSKEQQDGASSDDMADMTMDDVTMDNLEDNGLDMTDTTMEKLEVAQ
jgi:Cu(I)/Ag(I) efflux system membrane fusion protein